MVSATLEMEYATRFKFRFTSRFKVAIEGRILSDANDIICVMFSFIVLSFCVHIDEVCQQGQHEVLSESLLNRNSINYRVTKYIQMELVPIKSLRELT